MCLLKEAFLLCSSRCHYSRRFWLSYLNCLWFWVCTFLLPPFCQKVQSPQSASQLLSPPGVWYLTAAKVSDFVAWGTEMVDPPNTSGISWAQALLQERENAEEDRVMWPPSWTQAHSHCCLLPQVLRGWNGMHHLPCWLQLSGAFSPGGMQFFFFHKKLTGSIFDSSGKSVNTEH